MKKSKTPSMTCIRKALMEAVFNPREPGSMKMIADVGNQNYFEIQAILKIKEAETYRACNPMNVPGYLDKLTTAMQFLALAKVACEKT